MSNVMPLFPVKVCMVLCEKKLMSHNNYVGEPIVYSDCSDGDLRLAGEKTAVSGRLEVCYNKVWGTVCNYVT